MTIKEHLEETRREFDATFPLIDINGGQIVWGATPKEVKSFLHSRQLALLEVVRGKVPEKKVECDCENEDGLGYHTKDCTFFPQGWNACRAAMLSALDEGSKTE